MREKTKRGECEQRIERCTVVDFVTLVSSVRVCAALAVACFCS